MAVPQFRYPLDKTGENPNNFVGNERHSLNPQPNLTNVRVLAPYYGPFFSNSIRIVDMANGRQLVKDTDYKITDLLQDAALSFGAPIGQFVVIINGLVSNEVAVSYQVLGGNYQNDATAIQHVYETFLNDTRPVDWSNISGKPLEYPPSLHIHLLEDVIGFGPVIVALEQVKEAILLGNTPVIQALIDWVKERKISWTSLVDIPPNLSGEYVPVTRSIATSPESGLVGGGDLTTDRSLALQRLFTEAKTYGSAKESLSITIDVFGRVSSIKTIPTVVKWADIEGVPKTAESIGLTDVVLTSGNQSIAGEKNFANLVGMIGANLGSTAANIHNSGKSAIMSEDSVRWLLANAIGGTSSNGVTKFNLGNLVVQYGLTGNAVIGDKRIAQLTTALRYGVGLTLPVVGEYGENVDRGDFAYFGPCYIYRPGTPYAEPRLLSQGSSTIYYGLYRYQIDGSVIRDLFWNTAGFWIVFGIA